MPEQVLTLSDAASLLGWSRRTLVRSLAKHGIPTIGTGRRARLDASDLEKLKAKEREGAREARGHSNEEAIAQASGGLSSIRTNVSGATCAEGWGSSPVARRLRGQIDTVPYACRRGSGGCSSGGPSQ